MADDKTAGVPGYQEGLGAYHRAFAAELRTMVADLEPEPGARVLDLACGDGVYSAWLAEAVGSGGRVVAVDIDPAYLELAAATARAAGVADRVELVEAPVERLPFEPGSFDLAWCAQSFRSLPDPVAALRVMKRLVRPGGTVAVLENDALHHLLLPWPVGLELAVRVAERVELAEEEDDPDAPYVGRRLTQAFRAAGLEDASIRTYALNRQAPLGEAERSFLLYEFAELRGRVADRLARPLLDRFDRLLGPDSPVALIDRPDFAMTIVDHVVRAVVD